MSVAYDFAPCELISGELPDWSAPAVPGVADRLASVSVLHAPSERDTANGLRLTLRGQVVIGLVVAVLGGVLLWLASASAPASAGAGATPSSVTVQPGDTLWGIATRVAPQADPRAEVASLQKVNHLSGVDLVPGQVLRLG